ncbi:hypothetical protein JYU34_005531 [Plutella xylostella]|uniref:Uncharacterized protein n=1 Tax=Plutella xylostella TaxID=51655 RepID=A0ABQ7QTF7_PLUXY|nr:hypothetical protein JYU34_005531 [Plutella xylostella]
MADGAGPSSSHAAAIRTKIKPSKSSALTRSSESGGSGLGARRGFRDRCAQGHGRTIDSLFIAAAPRPPHPAPPATPAPATPLASSSMADLHVFLQSWKVKAWRGGVGARAAGGGASAADRNSPSDALFVNTRLRTGRPRAPRPAPRDPRRLPRTGGETSRYGDRRCGGGLSVTCSQRGATVPPACPSVPPGARRAGMGEACWVHVCLLCYPHPTPRLAASRGPTAERSARAADSLRACRVHMIATNSVCIKNIIKTIKMLTANVGRSRMTYFSTALLQ